MLSLPRRRCCVPPRLDSDWSAVVQRWPPPRKAAERFAEHPACWLRHSARKCRKPRGASAARCARSPALRAEVRHPARRPRADPCRPSAPRRPPERAGVCTRTCSTETFWPSPAARRIRSPATRTRLRQSAAILRVSAARSPRVEWSSSSGRKRELDAERGAPADLRRKVYRTVMELYNSEGTGQSDAVAAGSRCKEELENFLAVFRGNAAARVAHGDFRHFAAAAQHQPQLPPGGHGLDGVEHQVQHRLFQQRAVHIHFRDVNRQKLRHLYF